MGTGECEPDSTSCSPIGPLVRNPIGLSGSRDSHSPRGADQARPRKWAGLLNICSDGCASECLSVQNRRYSPSRLFTLPEPRLSSPSFYGGSALQSGSTKMVGDDSLSPPACGRRPGLLCCLQAIPSPSRWRRVLAHLLRIVLSCLVLSCLVLAHLLRIVLSCLVHLLRIVLSCASP